MSAKHSLTTASEVPSNRARRIRVSPTGIESPFSDDEIIVSKTDLTGRITYANDVFQRVSGFTQSQLSGAPHSILRHPEMPRVLFHLLWEELKDGHEVFAYIVNLCANGNHYWVFAHVTPTTNGSGQTVGYHSARRTVKPSVLPTVRKMYSALLETEQAIERSGGTKADAIAASQARLSNYLSSKGMTYDELIWSF